MNQVNILAHLQAHISYQSKAESNGTYIYIYIYIYIGENNIYTFHFRYLVLRDSDEAF